MPHTGPPGRSPLSAGRSARTGYWSRRATARANSAVEALPPKSLVRTLSFTIAVSSARRSRLAASISPTSSSIIAAASSWAEGFAIPCPAMSGAEPCTASKIAACSPIFAPGASPSPPTSPDASSERMSTNRLVVTITSNCAGLITSCIAALSTIFSSDAKIVDNAAMQLVINPAQFDVIVTTNLFVDILSDEASGLVGGLGLAPGANIGEHAAIFEAVHGSAPDIAGQGIANPSAQLPAAAVMLDHVGEIEAASRLRRALETAIVKDNVRTKDLGGSASTAEFARAVARRLQ